MGNKRTFAIEIDANELRVSMFEAIADLARPANMSAEKAWEEVRKISPFVADAADRCAMRAMVVIASAASKGSMVQ